MNDKKRLAIAVAALAVIIAAALAIYNGYQGRVDPLTGAVSGASQTDPLVLGASIGTEKPAAPDFAMEDANGNAVQLSDFTGKPVVLNFWTSWCKYCREEMPYFESAYQQYGSQIQFVMLNPVKSEKSGGDGKDFIEASGYTFPVFYETAGKAVTLYGVRGFPATMFIDAGGKIMKKNMGKISKEQLNGSIKTLLEEE